MQVVIIYLFDMDWIFTNKFQIYMQNYTNPLAIQIAFTIFISVNNALCFHTNLCMYCKLDFVPLAQCIRYLYY